MSDLTHAQARQYLDAQADGVLNAAQTSLLDAHLAQCATCQDYARWLNNYAGWLETSLQAGAPARRLSSTQELYHIRHQIEGKLEQTKSFKVAAGWLAAAAMFVVLPVMLFLLLQTRPSGTVGDPNAIPPGLLIVTGNFENRTRSLWIQERNGELELLVESDYDADFTLSPDGTQVLYTAEGDIWLFDLATRQSQNVTQTPELFEWSPEWRPGGLVYVSTPSDQMGELTDATPPAALPRGLLTSLTFGGMPETLVPEPVAPLRIAPSPDGQAVAYITFNGATNDLWLNRAGAGTELIDLSGYQGQPWAMDVNWSPDGQQQLLALAGSNYWQDGSTHGAVALLDVASGDFRTLFIYNPIIRLDWILKAAPVWSPDGAWLIFPVHAPDPQSGLRVIERANMNESRHIDFAGIHMFDRDVVRDPARKSILPTPVISPDSQWAAMAVYEDVLLLRTADWQPILLGLEGNEQNFTVLDVLGWGQLEPIPEQPSPTPTPDRATLVPSAEVAPLTPAPTGDGATPTAVPVNLPPGLVYITGEMESPHPLWIVDSSGVPQQIVGDVVSTEPFPDFDISPDGAQMLYSYEGDIWLLDFASGEARNVTQTEDRHEQAPRWWPGRAGGFVCGSTSTDGGGMTTGQLTYVNLDGTYEVLDEGLMPTIPAPRPDGQIILYTNYRTESDAGGFDLYEYRLEQGSRPIAPAELGLADYVMHDNPNGPNWLVAGSMSWSADGSTLGLALHGQFQGEQHGGILTHEWGTASTRLLFSFIPPSIGAPLFSSAPRFAPDGSWLVFEARPPDAPNGRIYLWDGAEVRDLTGDLPLRGQWAKWPAVSPDGQWVAFMTTDGIGLLRAGEWEPVVIPIGDTVIGVGWAQPLN